MHFNHMRFTAAGAGEAGAPLGDIVARAASAGLDPLSITSLRAAGFRSLDAMTLDEGFRTAAPLPERSQVVIDDAVVRVGRERLQFVDDLLSEGLVYKLPDPLSVTFLEHQTRGRAATARRVMNPEARGENFLAKMGAGRIPVYLTMADFFLGVRELRMSRRIGLPLDTANIEDATRAVNEAIEDAAINGTTTLDGQTFLVDGYGAPGLLTAPNANTKALSQVDWQTTPNGTNIMLAITQMISQLVADKKYGPYNLYVPTGTMISWQLDFKSTGNDSILARMSNINVGGRSIKIKSLDYLPTNKVVMVQMTNDVVDIIDGQRPTVIPFTSLSGLTFYNLILACMIPRFRSDYDGNSGIVIGTMS